MAQYELAADLVHGALGADEINRIDAVGGGFGADAIAHEVGDFVVRARGRAGSLTAEDGAGVPFGRRKQAIADLAFGGEAQAVAVAAEGLRDGLNQADAAAAVGVLEVAGRLAGMRAADRHERAEFGFEDAADGFAVEHVGGLPMLLGVERHVFDESQFEAAVASETCQRHDFLFGEAVDRDRIEPDLFKAGVAGRRRCRLARDRVLRGARFSGTPLR